MLQRRRPDHSCTTLEPILRVPIGSRHRIANVDVDKDPAAFYSGLDIRVVIRIIFFNESLDAGFGEVVHTARSWDEKNRMAGCEQPEQEVTCSHALACPTPCISTNPKSGDEMIACRCRAGPSGRNGGHRHS